jgi:TolA-binding protein
MKSHVFVFFSLIIAIGFLQAFHAFDLHFSGINELKREQKILSAHIEHKELQFELAEYRLQEMRYDVALVISKLPQKLLKGEKAYPLRRLASVTQTKINPKHLTLFAKRHFLKGKKLFQKRQFNEANEEFFKIIQEYTYSAHLVESYFLFIEGLYQMNRYEEAIGYIDKLVSQFPESELTGYAMLRLGKIFESQDRHEEASGIYKTIMQSFKDYNLIQQAKLSFRSIKI